MAYIARDRDALWLRLPKGAALRFLVAPIRLCRIGHIARICEPWRANIGIYVKTGLARLRPRRAFGPLCPALFSIIFYWYFPIFAQDKATRGRAAPRVLKRAAATPNRANRPKKISFAPSPGHRSESEGAEEESEEEPESEEEEGEGRGRGGKKAAAARGKEQGQARRQQPQRAGAAAVKGAKARGPDAEGWLTKAVRAVQRPEEEEEEAEEPAPARKVRQAQQPVQACSTELVCVCVL